MTRGSFTTEFYKDENVEVSTSTLVASSKLEHIMTLGEKGCYGCGDIETLVQQYQNTPTQESQITRVRISEVKHTFRVRITFKLTAARSSDHVRSNFLYNICIKTSDTQSLRETDVGSKSNRNMKNIASSLKTTLVVELIQYFHYNHILVTWNSDDVDKLTELPTIC